MFPAILSQAFVALLIAIGYYVLAVAHVLEQMQRKVIIHKNASYLIYILK